MKRLTLAGAALAALAFSFGCAAAVHRTNDSGLDLVEVAVTWANDNINPLGVSLPETWFAEVTVVDLPADLVPRLLPEEGLQASGLLVTPRPVHTAAAWLALEGSIADTQFVGRKWHMVEAGAEPSIEVMRDVWYTPNLSELPNPGYPKYSVATRVREGVTLKFRASPGQNGRVLIDGVLENHAILRPYTMFLSGTSPTGMTVWCVPEVKRLDFLFSAQVYSGEVIAMCTDAGSTSGGPVQRLVILSFSTDMPRESLE